jgi:trans-2,3-dihydro-3-hydroxyanthranilate isomerase
MSLRFLIVDVFTDSPLAGNQLAVFHDADDIAEELLQPLAREMHFAETVFLLSTAPNADARVRIFTPAIELPFAGHPLLGSAIVVGRSIGRDIVRLETGVGVIHVDLHDREAVATSGRMVQPVPRVDEFTPSDALFQALGVDGSELPVKVYDNGVRHAFVILASTEGVSSLEPDMGRLAKIAGHTGVSCAAGAGRRWTTRMFMPGGGIPEDPATGSAAGPLAVHLALHQRIDWGEEITISQGAAIDRPSTLLARAEGSSKGVTRVEVGGSALVVAEGEFRLPSVTRR